MQCKHCGYDKRVIKYGLKPGKTLLQRWFCCSCNRYCFTPLSDGQNNNKDKAKASISNIDETIEEEPDKSPFQQYQKEQLAKRRSEKDLIKQATNGAMKAINRKKKRR